MDDNNNGTEDKQDDFRHHLGAIVIQVFPGGWMGHISNTDAHRAIDVIREFLEKLEDAHAHAHKEDAV